MRILASILCLAILESCNPSYDQNLLVNNTTNYFNRNVDSIVIDKMTQYKVPGLSIGLVRNDSIVYMNGYGVKGIEERNVVTENSIFHTASISKMFTALAIMDLVKNLKLSLDDRLVDVVPELNYDDKRVELITIKNLLNHTSGLPDVNNYNWHNNNHSTHALKDFVLGQKIQLVINPSTKYLYSNLGYDIIGYVIEKVSGSNFDVYLKENILNKNKMYESDFRIFHIADSLKTTPHSKRWISNKVYERKTYPYTREHAPSSTLNSSTKELSQWMISFMNDLKHPDSVYERMIETSSNSQVGLGFQLGNINSVRTIGHYGGDKGFRSYLIMLPDKKIGLVLLANCDYNEDFRQEILQPIAILMLMQSQLNLED